MNLPELKVLLKPYYGEILLDCLPKGEICEDYFYCDEIPGHEGKCLKFDFASERGKDPFGGYIFGDILDIYSHCKSLDYRQTEELLKKKYVAEKESADVVPIKRKTESSIEDHPARTSQPVSGAGSFLIGKNLEEMSESERLAVTYRILSDHGDGKKIPFKDDALVHLFSDAYRGDLKFSPAFGWRIWDGRRFKSIEHVEVIECIRKLLCKMAEDINEGSSFKLLKGARKERILEKLCSLRTWENIERGARGYHGLVVDHDLWDRHVELLNTPSGVVDLRTGEMGSHSRDFLMTRMTRVDSLGKCPTWESFLSDTFRGDDQMIGFMQRLCGYCLYGDPKEEVIGFLYGTGGNGKSTFLETIRRVLGRYATSAPSNLLLSQKSSEHPMGIAQLMGARLVVSPEVKNGLYWDEARVKQLTGRDRVSARFLYKNYFDFQPEFTILVTGNHKPMFTDVDEGIRRRLILVPFDVVIPEAQRDRNLRNRLNGELSGILSWMIKGCTQWYRSGLNPPRRILEATSEYMSDSDVFQEWLDENCQLHADFESRSNDLYQHFKIWKKNRGEYPVGQNKFVMMLKERGFSRRRHGSIRFMRGVKLNDFAMHAVSSGIYTSF
jgi:putative DNA primase/helicase